MIDDVPELTPGLPLAESEGVTCIKCGYDLSGLPRGGVCPECGVPIHQSLDRGPLAFLERREALALKRGMRLVLWAMYLLVINFMVLIGALASGMYVLLWGAIPLMIAGAALWIVGWHIAMSVRADGAGRGSAAIKWIAIVTAWLQTVVSVVAVGAIVLDADRSGRFILLTLAMSLVMTISGAWRLASLARRSSHKNQSRFASGAADVTRLLCVVLGINLAGVVGLVVSYPLGILLLLVGLPLAVAALVGVHALLWGMFEAARDRAGRPA